jgi:hypothetical protein
MNWHNGGEGSHFAQAGEMVAVTYWCHVSVVRETGCNSYGNGIICVCVCPQQSLQSNRGYILTCWSWITNAQREGPKLEHEQRTRVYVCVWVVLRVSVWVRMSWVSETSVWPRRWSRQGTVSSCACVCVWGDWKRGCWWLYLWCSLSQSWAYKQPTTCQTNVRLYFACWRFKRLHVRACKRWESLIRTVRNNYSFRKSISTRREVIILSETSIIRTRREVIILSESR